MTLLRRRMTEDMQVRNFSPHTQDSYVQQVSLFARYFRKSPEVLGPEEIRSYQIYLTNEKKLAPSSILIAVSALRFLYKVTLHRDWCFEDIIPAPKKPQTLPIVLSPEEVLQFLSCVQSINVPTGNGGSKVRSGCGHAWRHLRFGITFEAKTSFVQ